VASLIRRVGLILILSVVAAPIGRAKDAPVASAELLDLLKNSKRPLSEGDEGCKGFTEWHSTLGALVSDFGRQANGRRKAWCSRPKDNSRPLSCAAEFANKVPSERSEEEFFLRIDFELKRGTIGAFKCFMAE
jgi:hypothetical protein